MHQVRETVAVNVMSFPSPFLSWLQESRALSQGWGWAAEGAGAELSSSAQSGCPDVPGLHCPGAGGMGGGAGWSPVWGKAAHSLCGKNLYSSEFFCAFTVVILSVRAVTRCSWSCHESPKQILEMWLSCQLGGAQVKLSLWSRCQCKVTDHLAESSDTKKEPTFPPGGSVLFIFPGTYPAPLAPSLAFQVSSAEPDCASAVCASTEWHVCCTRCGGPLAFH